MKRIKYFIFTLLAASTIFVSCDLDRNPLDKFAENDFWTSEDNAELALFIKGIYCLTLRNILRQTGGRMAV